MKTKKYVIRQPKYHLNSKKLMYNYYSMEKFVDRIVLNKMHYSTSDFCRFQLSAYPDVLNIIFNPDNCRYFKNQILFM